MESDPAAKPEVAVVLCVYDAAPAYLRSAIASILDQTWADFELILVEDPGGERSATTVLDECTDARIRHVANATRIGLAASRNVGLRSTEAPLVAMMDGDDLCAPDRLARQVQYLHEHPHIDVVGTQIAVVGDNGQQLGYRTYPKDHRDILRALRRYNPVAHPTVMMRRTAVLAAGAYSGSTTACDDYELWSRMARQGFRFANLQDALLQYRLHAGAMKTKLLRDTLRDTIWVKRAYWLEALSLGDRLRMWGERFLLLLPPAFVAWLFRKATIRRRLST